MSLLNQFLSWYFTSHAQAILLGIIFLLNFAAYLTIQAFSQRTYGDVLASNTTFALYITFTLSSFVAPAICLRLGPRRTLALGIMGYATLVVASLAYFEYDISDRVVILGGIVNGFGAALLWNAQGVLILQYSDQGNNSGSLIGIFLGFFNASAIIGGTLSFWYFHSMDDQGGNDPTMLYLLFLGFILAAAICTRFLLQPSQLRKEKNEDASESKEDALNLNSESQQLLSIDQSSDLSIVVEGQERSLSWKNEAVQTLTLFRTRRMRNLLILFFYYGYKQPYQIVTFGDRYFNDALLGLEVTLFYFVCGAGAVWIGRVLDGSWWFWGGRLVRQHRVVAIRNLWVSVIVTTLGNICAVIQEWDCRNAISDKLCVVPLDYTDGTKVIVPTVAYACWGFTEAVVMTYIFWLIGVYYESQEDQSRAMAFYACIHSFGWAVGFWFIPASRMKPFTQLTWTIVIFFVGTFLCLLELPPPNLNLTSSTPASELSVASKGKP
mmetsp:Transcript_6948/g.10536  ORF Transcript_6948/g.10536 Transcript_6948/m.10536 type:complete len:494 (-) Transcript_6948:545-2026(-)|eukprot:CAMPEP_0195295596 /NCGR_PEP_ID=MMETSP0707-20130614/17667_1 /TAXON_ID=33640 /ORGANISM="Asterionellopsis glacialis, Strain CCMP134" /LENGTH=493 /DNA_ID=CAMNT_0040356849 /DNA_START=62 /DNA_END=1543 /DNA_ORIENTATION=-